MVSGHPSSDILFPCVYMICNFVTRTYKYVLLLLVQAHADCRLRFELAPRQACFSLIALVRFHLLIRINDRLFYVCRHS